ncbi:hypothetical protein D3C84_714180 [compost metagenome]
MADGGVAIGGGIPGLLLHDVGHVEQVVVVRMAYQQDTHLRHRRHVRVDSRGVGAHQQGREARIAEGRRE